MTAVLPELTSQHIAVLRTMARHRAPLVRALGARDVWRVMGPDTAQAVVQTPTLLPLARAGLIAWHGDRYDLTEAGAWGAALADQAGATRPIEWILERADTGAGARQIAAELGLPLHDVQQILLIRRRR
jgi:hypothetical protein